MAKHRIASSEDPFGRIHVRRGGICLTFALPPITTLLTGGFVIMEMKIVTYIDPIGKETYSKGTGNSLDMAIKIMNGKKSVLGRPPLEGLMDRKCRSNCGNYEVLRRLLLHHSLLLLLHSLHYCDQCLDRCAKTMRTSC